MRAFDIEYRLKSPLFKIIARTFSHIECPPFEFYCFYLLLNAFCSFFNNLIMLAASPSDSKDVNSVLDS